VIDCCNPGLRVDGHKFDPCSAHGCLVLRVTQWRVSVSVVDCCGRDRVLDLAGKVGMCDVTRESEAFGEFRGAFDDQIAGGDGVTRHDTDVWSGEDGTSASAVSRRPSALDVPVGSTGAGLRSRSAPLRPTRTTLPIPRSWS